MGVPAGNLNQRIVIEKPIKADNAAGRSVVESWQAIHCRNLPASYKAVSGGEIVRGMQIVSGASALFETRWLDLESDPSVQPTEHRLRWITGSKKPENAPVFGINHVENPDGVRTMLAIQCNRLTQ
tara:strand:+ start:2695 stop:3072 length:378 start_codon:yes stop_codon:yes gene_type:complete